MGTWICPEILVVNICNSQYYLLQSSYIFIYVIVISKFWVISCFLKSFFMTNVHFNQVFLQEKEGRDKRGGI